MTGTHLYGEDTVSSWNVAYSDANFYGGDYSFGRDWGWWLDPNAWTGNDAVGTFHFTGVAPGYYDVSATWYSEYTSRCPDVVYSITENSTTLDYHADQTVTPDEPVYDGVPWKTMFTSIYIGDGTADVSVAWGSGDGYVSADAVRLTAAVPEPSVLALLVTGLLGLLAYAWRKRK